MNIMIVQNKNVFMKPDPGIRQFMYILCMTRHIFCWMLPSSWGKPTWQI